MRVAAIQTTAGPHRQANLDSAEALIEEAAGQGARLAVLPEYFSVAGSPRFLRENAETLDGPTVTWASQVAERLGIWLLAGSIPERPEEVAGEHSGDSARLFNTSCLINPQGDVSAAYRKIHLFDIALTATRYSESATIAPGSALSVTPLGDSPHGTQSTPPILGLSICYDLRFPEVYRIMTLLGSTIIAVPAAFTAATGPAHWELLLRARAVENQVFVIGAGQVGELPPGMPAAHGHSMVIDPWGSILAERKDPNPGIVVADLDFSQQERIRTEIPVLANRRPEAYRWPHAGPADSAEQSH
jgi:predicted amidohydrolase